MGGKLHCESRVGLGTTFSFTLDLPRTRRPSQAHADAGLQQDIFSAEEGAVPLAGRVLVVEDNPVNAMIAQATLENLGLEVAVAENGLHALEWLRSHEPDLVLMDFHMPEMGGIEATRRIRELEVRQGWAPMPIVAMSAGDQIDDHRHCLEVGMNDYISKPFRLRELVARIRAVLRRVPPVDEPMDFSAWFEVYLGGRWFTFDARHNHPRIGRILMGTGRDAADVALTTSFGRMDLVKFFVISDEVVPA